MKNHLSLLQLYSEWGVDEVLHSLCINHLEDVSPVSATSTIRPKQPISDNIIYTPDQDISLHTNNLQEICQAILEFRNCPLRDTAMHTVLPAGDPTASLFIIGDVPDADEDRSGKVFSGQNEFWLHQMLGNIHISLEECFRMPLIPWRPPGGRQVSRNELNLCLPFIYRLLTLYKPSHILTIGVLPIRTLLKTSTPFNQLRGKWHPLTLPDISHTIQLGILPHPSQLNNSAKIRQATWKDLLKIRATI